MKLTATFIVIAFGSMLARAAEPAVISSATSSVTSSPTSTSTATSKIAAPTPLAPVQASPTPADKTKITVPFPKPPVANPNNNIRPPRNHWFAPHNPYRPAPRPYGYPPKPYLRGADGMVKRSRFNLRPAPGMICYSPFGCGGANIKNWRLGGQKRAILAPGPYQGWRFPPPTHPNFPFSRPFRRPAQKRAPIIAPICKGITCPSQGRYGWPFWRVNARSAEAEAEPEALWCNPATGAGCGPGYRRKNGGPIDW